MNDLEKRRDQLHLLQQIIMLMGIVSSLIIQVTDLINRYSSYQDNDGTDESNTE